MDSKKISHLLAIIVMVIWGFSYLSIKVVVAEIDPTISALYRFSIAAVILFLILKFKYPEEKVLKEDKVKLASGGVFGVSLYFFFENYSVFYTTASNVAILISSIPVFTLISQSILYKEKLTPKKVIGSFLSVVGIVIIIASKERVSLFSEGTLGDLMALGCAFCWVIYNMISTKFKGNYKSITITTYQTLWGTLFLTPALFISPIKMPSIEVSLNLLFQAVFCSCVGYVLYIKCLEKLGATVLTTYINLQPILSLVAAALILKESITTWQIIGSITIILGVFMVSFKDRVKKEDYVCQSTD